jgi:hypothetical protein
MLLTVIITASYETAYSWDDNVTHYNITRYAAGYSTLDVTKGDALKAIGFRDGLNELLTWRNRETRFVAGRVQDWLAEGSRLEDSGARWLNHFHNPLKPWPQAGLTDILPGQSALLWAQNYDGQQWPMTDDWSWQRTRKLYHLALTSETPELRSMFFAETFRGLGQQMHLLQDMAVPHHVRNDAHPMNTVLGWTCSVFGNANCSFFEVWTANEYPNLVSLEGSVRQPYKPANIVFSVPSDDGVPYPSLAPTTVLFDANVYHGMQPIPRLNINPTSTDYFGLSEYTNANFFSEDTINLPGNWPNPSQTFPYPNVGSTDLLDYLYSNALPAEIIAEDGVPDTGIWIRKTGDGELIDHLAKPGYTTSYLRDTFSDGRIFSRSFILDEKCHRDYTQKLLPLAIGYSAGLLDYFFRGDLSLSLGGQRSNEFVVKNENPYEDMDGTLRLYQEDSQGNRSLIGTTDDIAIPKNSSSQPIAFNIPSDSFQYTLVFQGKMGNEEGAVVGRVGQQRWWREEWDQDELTASHPWIFTDIDIHIEDYDHQVSTTIVDGRLVQKNVRLAGSPSAHINQAYLGASSLYEVRNGVYFFGSYQVGHDFKDRFPYLVTPHTWISMKLNVMDINIQSHAQKCSGVDWPTGAYQGLVISYKHGENRGFLHAFTRSGHESYMVPTTFVNTGEDFSINLYNVISQVQPIIGPVYLESVNIVQQMLELCEVYPVDQVQHMEVDYVRLEER